MSDADRRDPLPPIGGARSAAPALSTLARRGRGPMRVPERRFRA